MAAFLHDHNESDISTTIYKRTQTALSQLKDKTTHQHHFFFFIGKQNFIKEIKELQLGALRRRISYIGGIEEFKVKSKEVTNSARDVVGVRPQTLAQSNKVPKNNSKSLAKCSLSYKMRLLHSRHIVHKAVTPTKVKIRNLFRHYPKNPKRLQNKVP